MPSAVSAGLDSAPISSSVCIRSGSGPHPLTGRMTGSVDRHLIYRTLDMDIALLRNLYIAPASVLHFCGIGGATHAGGHHTAQYYADQNTADR